MNGMIQFTSVQYAVIQISSIKGSPERMVIAYPNEETLRGLIAGPSIIAFGFVSRDKALASVDGDFLKTDVSRQANETPIAGGNKKGQADSIMDRLLDRFSLSKSCQKVRSFLNFALASAILIFYSGNIVAATFRSVLGCSI
jgi:hypothetical protein